ncbi:MAG TPA: aromatic ring-hydroxylating dioxygenase subunit alpha [Novosphingobium sp.]|nr:aromatic ring-hydroxylating dioxygenase subunit alpha [Novosphingobium sp.]
MVQSNLFTQDEIKGIRDGFDGVRSSLPPRFYYDEDFYQWEVENILKKQWLIVGRQEEALNPGDYFTIRMFDEPIVIIRGRDGVLRALINVCQHRFAQIVEEGRGNTKLMVCPFHRWTYNLDGTLQGVSVEQIPGFDKKNCRMPELRLEIWQGFVFINFDPDAEPLAPQYAPIDPIFDAWKVADFQHSYTYEFEAPWNWKLTVEAGMEGYHHVGVHHDRIEGEIPAKNTEEAWGGKACCSYHMWWKDGVPQEYLQPFGTPPGVEGVDWDNDPRVLFGFPTMGTWLNNYQSTYLIFEFGNRVTANRGKICQAFPKWALETPGAEEAVKFQTDFAYQVQLEDEYACKMVQKGITSKTNGRAVLHPRLEVQMSKFYNWYLDKVLEAEGGAPLKLAV